MLSTNPIQTNNDGLRIWLKQKIKWDSPPRIEGFLVSRDKHIYAVDISSSRSNTLWQFGDNPDHILRNQKFQINQYRATKKETSPERKTTKEEWEEEIDYWALEDMDAIKKLRDRRGESSNCVSSEGRRRGTGLRTNHGVWPLFYFPVYLLVCSFEAEGRVL